MINVTQAASFDCKKASSKTEKLICTVEEVSVLDDELSSTYSNLLKLYTAEEKSLAITEQRRWLKQKRNACADQACLVTVYTKTVEEIKNLDTFSDMEISCDEMRRLPAYIFKGGIDFGSGFGSPVEVDYDCKESLVSLPFMKKLLSLAETVRSDYGPQLCTGSIVHAQWRYYHFSLAKAGYIPTAIEDNDVSNVLSYFEQWSWQSPYNNKLYNAFFAEFDKAYFLLSEHYVKTFLLTKLQADTRAKNALMLTVRRVAGGFPQRILKKTTSWLV